MSPRRRRPSLEERLDQISALRKEPDAPETLSELEKNLADKQNLLAGRAARVIGDLGKGELVPAMLDAFERFMKDPVESDKGCIAKTEIAKALVAMEHPAYDLFLRGLRHKQMEGAYGGPIDVAIELRANCALGLANAGHPDTVVELVPLLLDTGFPARLAAAQGIASSGQLSAEAVLRFKVLTGDAEPEVLTECLAGLLRLAPERSLRFIKPLLSRSRRSSDDDAVYKEAAILALGESRLEQAVPLLEEQWERTYDAESRRLILLALVTSRREPALDFLMSLIAEGELREGREAMTALAVHRHDSRIRERVEEAWQKSRHRDELEPHFAREFD